MSDQYQREEGQGALFENTDKDPGSNQPDYTGVIRAGGKDMRLAAWNRESKNGRAYLSVKMSEQRPKQEAPKEPFQETLADDSIPF